MKYDFAFCAVGAAGKKGVFYTSLKFEILDSGIEVLVAHPKVTVAT
jgi:late competence protein required for DNA uptake (superfamily II DNA/RNA helicase)